MEASIVWDGAAYAIAWVDAPSGNTGISFCSNELKRVPASSTTDRVLQDGTTWYYLIRQRGL